MHPTPANEHRSSRRTTLSSSSSLGNEIVSRLTWRDSLSGIAGEYTGQINDRRQPHGYGIVVYADNSVTASIWANGVPVQSSSRGDDNHQPRRTSPPPKNKTYVHKLELGDVGTHRYMMPAESSQSEALEKIKPLQTHDFAFVLRSSGQWTYAIIADRQEHFMLFVLDALGNAKRLDKNDWATSIRLVNPSEACSPVPCRHTRRGNNSTKKKAQQE